MPSGVFSLKQQAQARSEGAWPGSPPTTLNYLVVAGGGAGGDSNGGGGGGGGGLLQGVIQVTPGASYTVTVGGGGTASSGAVGGSGSASVFGSISASGGGGGGAGATAPNGISGGSGGGIGRDLASAQPGQGTAGQGNRGGQVGAASNGGSGGGGAGTIGGSSLSVAGVEVATGAGGAGIASDISGVRTTYAGGGGGVIYANATPPAGGAGGGGSGANGSGGTTVALAGGSNTGGGGGGGGTAGLFASLAKNGGSGIVIVSYPGTTQWFTGGTLSYANGNVIHTFYSSGTLAPTAPSNFVNTDYQIARSLRFNSADSAYLGRTPGSASNRKTFTWSGWIKRSKLGLDGPRMFVAGSGSDIFIGRFLTGDNFQLVFYNGTNYGFSTVQVFRDVSSWYHFVIAVDTTQPTAADRFKLYVNGTQVTNTTSLGALVPQNTDLPVNNTVAHSIGIGGGNYFDGYLTEVNFIDGQALTPSAFGYVNPNTGVWSPLKFVGTYGTNGFYLNFSDNSNTTATTLGKDYSGNGNNWTPNNFSVTAGAGNDSLVDTPTPYGTDTGAGGEVRGNYAVLNPLNTFASPATFSNGNLEVENNSGTGTRQNCVATVGLPTTGKWYFEVSPLAMGSGVQVLSAIRPSTSTGVDYPGADSNNPGISVSTNGTRNFNAVYTSSYLPTSTVGDVLSCAYDADTRKVWFARNGTFVGSPSAGTSEAGTLSALTNGGTYLFDLCLLREGGASGNLKAFANFGQRPFAYTAPSGFKALVNQNLPTPTIGATSTTQAGDYFNTLLYTGDNANPRTLTGVGFQPDLVWLRARNTTANHNVYDAVRGTGKVIFTDLTLAEATNDSYGYISAFTSDGFTVTGSSVAALNGSGNSMVAWNWKANGAGSSNTSGTITSTVSANTTAGFSIVTYTGTGSNATVGHGLGVAPSMIIVKNRTDGTRDWLVYHASIGNTAAIFLNLTNAPTTLSAYWNNTSPTSSVFSLGNSSAGNGSTNNLVAYCFAPVAGYSAFGSYTGNGSTDGPFVYTGFRPAYLLIKRSNDAADWYVYDAKRNTYNALNSIISPDLSSAEATNSAYAIDFTANGFKLRLTATYANSNASTYIYAAFAESPFKYALAR